MKDKNRDLIFGTILVLISFALIYFARIVNIKEAQGIVYGFIGWMLIDGIMLIYKYFYWKLPKNAARYDAVLHEAEIARHDERNIMLRDKSGRYAYIFMLIVSTIAILFFKVLSVFKIIAVDRLVFMVLGFFVLLQLASGIVIFNILNKKY